MGMQIETLTVGPLEVNCYIIGCPEHKVCAVIDPGDSSKRILGAAESNGWDIKLIINTHAHADHTGANGRIKEASGAPILIHKADAEMLTHPAMTDMAAYLGVGASPDADRLVEDGDEIELCDHMKFRVLHTPGHSPGGICLLAENKLISGDTLFRMSIGRSDLHGGDMTALINSIRMKIFTLPDDVEIYPGHGDPTTVGFEKGHNPFLTGAFA